MVTLQTPLTLYCVINSAAGTFVKSCLLNGKTYWISFTDTKPRTTLYSIINTENHRKAVVLPSCFLLITTLTIFYVDSKVRTSYHKKVLLENFLLLLFILSFSSLNSKITRKAPYSSLVLEKSQ